MSILYTTRLPCHGIRALLRKKHLESEFDMGIGIKQTFSGLKGTTLIILKLQQCFLRRLYSNQTTDTMHLMENPTASSAYT